MTVPTRKRRGIQPFDADHLTDPEKALQSEQEHHTCVTCDWLGKQRRSGSRACERGNDPGPVLAGELICRDYLEVKRQ